MTMVALGLNLIYGFNGQFSLGQWGFYGIGAYAAADITYRWVNGDASGLFVAGFGVILGGVDDPGRRPAGQALQGHAGPVAVHALPDRRRAGRRASPS